jgi:hypothetical protein
VGGRGGCFGADETGRGVGTLRRILHCSMLPVTEKSLKNRLGKVAVTNALCAPLSVLIITFVYKSAGRKSSGKV